MPKQRFKKRPGQNIPTTRVSVIVINDEKQILLVKHRKRNRQYWVLPGGRLEYGETFFECAVREIKEESGLDVTLYFQNQFEGFDNYAFPLCPPYRMQLLKIDENLEYIDYVYFCKAETDVLKIQDDELDDLKWFSKEDLCNSSLVPHVKYLGQKAIECFENNQLLVYNSLMG